MVSEPATLPGNHGARPDKDERVAPAAPCPREARSEEAIGYLDAAYVPAALVDGELVTQSEDLKLEGGSRPKAGAEGGGEGEEAALMQAPRSPSRRWPWLAPEPM